MHIAKDAKRHLIKFNSHSRLKEKNYLEIEIHNLLQRKKG